MFKKIKEMLAKIFKRDLSRFERKKIVRVEFDDGDIIECVPALIDYDLGVTIINKNDYDHEVYCINGFSSKNTTSPYYDECFKFIIKCIRKGKFKQKDLHKLADKLFGEDNWSGCHEQCAFK